MNTNRQFGRPGRILGQAVLAAGLLMTVGSLAGAQPKGASEAAGNAQRFLAEEARADAPAWRYAEIPGYEVISQCGDEVTNDVMRAVIAGRQAGQALLPPGFYDGQSYPATLVLYNAPKGGPVSESRPDSKRASTLWRMDVEVDGDIIAESRVRAADRSYLCLALPPAAARGLGLGFTDPAHPVIPWVMEVVPAFELNHRVPQLPSWLVAGLAGPNGPFANGRRIRWAVPTHIDLPTAIWINEDETMYVREHGHPRVKLIAAKEFFEGHDQTGPLANVWRSEAGLLVRWGLYSKAYAMAPYTHGLWDYTGRARVFWDFAGRASGRPVDEAMFRKSFGFGYKELDSELEALLPNAVSNLISMQVDINLEPALPKLRNATPAESGRLVGDWERAEGESLMKRDPSVGAPLLGAGGATLEKASAGAGQDPELIGALGIYEAQAGSKDAAVAHLEAAVQGGSRRPLVYLTLAQLRYDACEAQADARGGKFSAAQEEAVLAPLRAARGLLPSMPATYRVAAKAILRGPAKPTKEALSIMAEGRQLYWHDPVFGGLADRVEAMAGAGPAAGG